MNWGVAFVSRAANAASASVPVRCHSVAFRRWLGVSLNYEERGNGEKDFFVCCCCGGLGGGIVWHFWMGGLRCEEMGGGGGRGAVMLWRFGGYVQIPTYETL